MCSVRHDAWYQSSLEPWKQSESFLFFLVIIFNETFGFRELLFKMSHICGIIILSTVKVVLIFLILFIAADF